MPYRLALDIGANSIGWAALTLSPDGHPIGLADAGVRVYPDGRNPKDGSSNAAARRAPRAMRRNRDRYLQRRGNLLNALTRFALMPADPDARTKIAALDPFALRAAALERRLLPAELGRAIFHLNQHRGFQSNRKTDRGDNESGLIKDAAANTAAELARTGHLTIGSWLAARHLRHAGVRVRLAGRGKLAAYAFYPTRDMLKAEFATIWAAQSAWNPALTDAMREALHGIIFHQRPLKSPPVGKCWLEPDQLRAPRALPTAQRFRLAQTLAHLQLGQPGHPTRPFNAKERELLLGILHRGSDLTFDQIRKKLGLSAETDFNSREDKIPGCAAAARLGAKKNLGATWHALPLATQDAAVNIILDAETDAAAIAALIALGLSPADAACANAINLPDGRAALSARALGKILPFLEAGEIYSTAVQSAGYTHHSDRRTGEIRDRLPYYGEILHARIGTGTGEATDNDEKRLGRAPNPTVHAALNEIRRVVNAIVERHGPPAEIVVETLRELGRSKLQRQAKDKEIATNRAANDALRDELVRLGVPTTGRNQMRLRLWKEQAADPRDRCCPYTGTNITARTALSDAVEEDHILPFALSLDDSTANRILVTREANRIKSRRDPFAAFGHTPQWSEILARVANLPEQKRWRFQPDALVKFAADGDFLARHLTDSATIARWAVEYLDILAPEKVRAVPGRLTSLLRNALGLNSESVLGKGRAMKDRTDHRHHTIDAIVVGLIDRSMLQSVTAAAQRAADAGRRLLMDVAEPWPNFVADVAARVSRVVVSHKPDTGWQAALHNDTAYGEIANAGPKDPNVVVRRTIDVLADKSPDDIRKSVRDFMLAAKIAAAVEGRDPTARKAALADLTHTGGHPVHRVRMVERLDSVQPITDRRTGQPYKLVKRDGNHRAEIWRMPDGKSKMCIVSTFAAAQQAEAERLGRPSPDVRPHPAARLIMRLHKNDIVALGRVGGLRLVRVVQMTEGRLVLADHNEAGDLRRRHADKDDPFAYIFAGCSRLIDDQARKVQVTANGRVRDPGPPR